MGSWAFVLIALAFLAGWMAANGKDGFDPYPFILLNLILSCLAALQGAILLIAAKRADSLSRDLAEHDYKTNVEAFESSRKSSRLTRKIHGATAERKVRREVPRFLLGPADQAAPLLAGLAFRQQGRGSADRGEPHRSGGVLTRRSRPAMPSTGSGPAMPRCLGRREPSTSIARTGSTGAPTSSVVMTTPEPPSWFGAGFRLPGSSYMIGRRGRDSELLNGPGKLTQALGIDYSHNGIDLFERGLPDSPDHPASHHRRSEQPRGSGSARPSSGHGASSRCPNDRLSLIEGKTVATRLDPPLTFPSRCHHPRISHAFSAAPTPCGRLTNWRRDSPRERSCG